MTGTVGHAPKIWLIQTAIAQLHSGGHTSHGIFECAAWRIYLIRDSRIRECRNMYASTLLHSYV
ncbi:hypothetical protein PTT_15201 [Pyrenophora teres f. teres 0-1]|uniref:Uncharacterized protein n=1 Tax=Pyrenophora teres f. teres (strain 0-1) TaxID=861557 RepID=E3RZQ7_PYRTT|nr:hypothetical protein PTT_15201 [Pyrenophora teres f. teres 0-1]